ncbi:MAG TPA: FAD-binding oxidoreductase [Candidatus Dormibacteraeota bacterium]|jgi:alkyldihydroxyacetonephosphate synthase|nr:FAD-binding oxidoreductase [Candidatus Dormibacteraeota bacterium]
MTAVDAVLPVLRAIVGEQGVSTSRADRAAVAHDLWPRALIRARQGTPPPPPDCVVWPRTAEHVAQILEACGAAHVPVTPFGAGTGVCGAVIAQQGGVALDLKRMDRITAWDMESGHVTVEPGVLGIALEEACLERGCTLGHYPSSLPVSTIGGFVATRSVGQLSTRYGRIDDMVTGMRVVLPDGTMVHLRPQPSTGVGPDLRRLFLGSEGTFGVIVEVTLRLHQLPEHRADAAFRFDSFAGGVAAIRDVMRRGLRPSLLRLYDPDDTNLQVDHLGIGSGGGCLVLASTEGSQAVAAAEMAVLAAICNNAGAEALGPGPVLAWYPRRYEIGYQQAKYLPMPGVVLDTIEVAAPWAHIVAVYDAVKESLRQRLVVLCHLSHGYIDGACLYFTFAGAAETEPGAVPLHEELWDTVMSGVLANGGTIAHHHGAGLARAPYLARELGEGGVEVLRRLKHALDPAGIANPGKWGLDG